MELELHMGLYEERPKRISGGWTDAAIVGLTAPEHAISGLEQLLKTEGRKSVEEIREKIENYYNNCSKGSGPYRASDFTNMYRTLESFLGITMSLLEASESVRKTSGFYVWDKSSAGIL